MTNDLKTEQAAQVLPISVGAVSEIGRRQENQDCMTGFSSPFGAVYLIADGMGGHRGGAEASRMVAEAFSRHLLAAPATSPARDAVTLAVRLTNVEILEKGKSGNPDFEGMGSTVVIALISQNGGRMELTTAHIGDSRAYLQRNGSLTQLTKDHTQVQWLIDSQAIDEAAARNHPDASVLTRALGHTTDLQVDISEPMPVVEGDSILLCSDGLSGFASAEDIAKTIRENPEPSACAQQLVQLALASGSNDNITVQFLRIGNAVARPGLARRDRETMIDRPLPAIPPVRAQRKSLSQYAWVAVLVAVVLIAGIVWYRWHPPGKNDDAVVKLGTTLDQFVKDAKACKDRAETDRKSASDDVKKLDDSAEGKKLKGEFETLHKSFKDVGENAGNLQEQATSTYKPVLEKIKQEAPSSNRNKDISDLTNQLNGSADALKRDTDQLDTDEKTKAGLEDQAKAHVKGAAKPPKKQDKHNKKAADNSGEDKDNKKDDDKDKQQ
jgi:serine/threonine protein phosphatase PrpC